MPNKLYPEHEKMAAVKDKSQIIGGFLDWLSTEGILLCKWDDNDRLAMVHLSIEEWLAQYFDIDLDKVEEEKKYMLGICRE